MRFPEKLKVPVVCLGATLALVSPNFTDESSAQNETICAPVYDETSNESIRSLLSTIEDYATNGIEVHVQVIQNGDAYGIQGPRDAQNFSEQLELDCGWTDPDILNIMIVLEPRAFDIYRAGTAEREISSRTVSSAESDFVNNLRDSSTPFQIDARLLLDEIAPFGNSELGGTDATAEQGSDQNSEPASIPYAKILSTIALVAAAAGLAARTRKGFAVNNLKKTTLHDTAEAINTAHTNSDEATQLLSALHEQDAQELREINAKLQDEISLALEAAMQLRTEARTQHARLWPTIGEVASKATTLRQAASRLNKVSQQQSRETDDVFENLSKIDTFVASFEASVLELEEISKAMQRDGWTFSSTLGQIESQLGLLTMVKSLRTQHYVEKPADIIENTKYDLDAIKIVLTNLPHRLTAIQEDFSGQDARLIESSDVAGQCQSLLAYLQATYNESCLTDVVNAPSTVLVALKKSQALRQELSNHIDVKDEDSLLAAELIIRQFHEQIGIIAEQQNILMQRQQLLKKLSYELPQKSKDIKTTLYEAHVKAFGDSSTDIEETTRSQIVELQGQLQNELVNGLDHDRPSYLSLNKAAQSLAKKADSVLRQVHEEAQEMIDLRRAIPQLLSDAQRELNELQRIATSNDVSGIVRSEAREITLTNDLNLSADRASLRSTRTTINHTLEEINQLQSEARRDKRKAEEERARKKREEEAREARERRNRNDSIGGSSSFGGFSGGSSSGGSHNSGSW